MKDLAGWLLAEVQRHNPERWTVLFNACNFGGGRASSFHRPARWFLIARTRRALCPEHFDSGGWQRSEEVGSYDWASLYQQRPAPSEGGILKRHWWRYWQPRGELSTSRNPVGGRWFR